MASQINLDTGKGGGGGVAGGVGRGGLTSGRSVAGGKLQAKLPTAARKHWFSDLTVIVARLRMTGLMASIGSSSGRQFSAMLCKSTAHCSAVCSDAVSRSFATR